VKRFYADLHILLSKLNVEAVTSTLKHLGFQTIGFTVQAPTVEDEVAGITDHLRKSGLGYIRRIDLKPYEGKHFQIEVIRARHDYDLLAAACESKHDLRASLRSGVDVVFINMRSRFTGVGEADFKLMADAGKVFEVNLRPLTSKEGPERAYHLSHVSRELRFALRFKVPVILSSGAVDMYDLRAPIDMAYILTMAGLRFSDALKTVSENPEALWKTVRSRRHPGYIMPGVRVLGREEGDKT